MLDRLEDEIIRLLTKHSDGLKVSDIAKELNTHRHTVSKYIFAMTTSGIIDQREVGRAKLCFLKDKKRKKL